MLLTTSAAGQTNNSTSDHAPIVLEFASETIRLYPALATAGAQAANRAADRVFDGLFGRPDGKGRRAIASRIARVYLVNLPIASLGHFAAHELGHVSRIHEAGLAVDGFRVTRWPWPLPAMRGVLIVDDLFASRYDDLSVTTGGSAGAFVQEQILTDQIYSQADSDYFDWILLLYAKLEMPLYTWASTMKGPFREPLDQGMPDPSRYAELFGLLRAEARKTSPNESRPTIVVTPPSEEIAAVSRTIDRWMWLNMADAALATALVRSVDYIRTGERERLNPVLRIGGVSLVPGARFSLTPVGLETAVHVRFIGRRRSHVELRSTETASGERLWGAGLQIQPAVRDKWALRFRGDVFQRRGDRVRLWAGPRRTGARVEVGAHGPLRIGRDRVDVGLRVGWKTRGYLVDAPEPRTVLAGVSMAVRF